MVLAFSHGLMEASIEDSFMKTILKDKEYTSGQTVESSKEIGEPTKWKERELLHGLIKDNTKVNTKMIRKKVLAFSLGLTEENTMGNGLTENSMAEEYTRQVKGK